MNKDKKVFITIKERKLGHIMRNGNRFQLLQVNRVKSLEGEVWEGEEFPGLKIFGPGFQILPQNYLEAQQKCIDSHPEAVIKDKQMFI